MKSLNFLKFLNSPKGSYWLNILAKFLSVQVVVQVLGFASGFLVIRALSKEEYGYLTIANSMQSMMNGLADSGVSIALSEIAGKVWNDKYRFGQLVNTALGLRKWLGFLAASLVTPFMVWILLKNHMSITLAIPLTLAVLFELYFYLESSVLETVPRFYSKIRTIQNLDIVFSVSRLLFLVIGYFTFLNSVVAAFISMVASALRTIFLRRVANQEIDVSAVKNLDDHRHILALVKSFLPNSVFYSFQGQISILLMSMFGSSQNIAEIGALSRFSLVFALFSPIMSSIIFPAFSRCQDLSLLRLRYYQIVLSNILLGIVLVLIFYFFSNQILWILGAKYYGLNDELLLVMLLSAVGHIGAVMWGLCTTKGWIRNMWIEIPIKISFQILLLIFMDLSNTKGVILFGILSSIPSIILVAIIAYQNLRIKLN